MTQECHVRLAASSKRQIFAIEESNDRQKSIRHAFVSIGNLSHTSILYYTILYATAVYEQSAMRYAIWNEYKLKLI
jgi:hypothetical protein